MISAEACFLVPPPQPTCWHHSELRAQCPGRGPHSSALSPAPVQPFPPEHQGSRESLGAGPRLLFVSGPLGPWWAGARDGVDTVCNPQTPMEKCPGEGAWQDAKARSKDLCFWGPNPPPSLLHVLSLNLFKCLTKIQIKNKNHSTVQEQKALLLVINRTATQTLLLTHPPCKAEAHQDPEPWRGGAHQVLPGGLTLKGPATSGRFPLFPLISFLCCESLASSLP